VAKAPSDPKIGKGLSALLQILRSHGVTHYETPELKLSLGPPPARHAPTAIDVSPEALAAELEQDEEEGDSRFLLERLGGVHRAATQRSRRRRC
jgi:hypothetical protein